MRRSISFFKGAKDRHPKVRRPDLDEVFQRWRRHDGPKLEAPAWSPAIYKPGDTRAKANVDRVSCLVLDIDGGSRLEDGVRALDGVAHWGHTSWSHTEELHKYRLIIPLLEPIAGADWGIAWRWAIERFGHLEPDRQCSDPSRLYFLPIFRPGQFDRLTWGRPGEVLSIPIERPPPVKRRRRARRWVSNVDDLGREVRIRLRTCSHARLAVAGQLGATVAGDRCIRGLCPQCGRRALWWYVDPTVNRSAAACNHRNSCGYTAELHEVGR